MQMGHTCFAHLAVLRCSILCLEEFEGFTSPELFRIEFSLPDRFNNLAALSGVAFFAVWAQARGGAQSIKEHLQ
jgi:hypothetical protein